MPWLVDLSQHACISSIWLLLIGFPRSNQWLRWQLIHPSLWLLELASSRSLIFALPFDIWVHKSIRKATCLETTSWWWIRAPCCMSSHTRGTTPCLFIKFVKLWHPDTLTSCVCQDQKTRQTFWASIGLVEVCRTHSCHCLTDMGRHQEQSDESLNFGDMFTCQL